MERYKLTIEEGVSMQEIMAAIFPSHVSVILDKISKCGRDYEYIKCLLDDLYVCWGKYDKSTYLLSYLKYSLGLFEIPVCGFMEVDERRGGIMHINMDTGKAWDEKGVSVPASQFENFFEERIMHTRLTTFALSVIKEWVRNKEIQQQATSEPQQMPQKRKGAPNKSNKDIRDCIQGEDKSIIERLKRLTLNTDGSRKRGNAFYLYIGVCVKEGFMLKPTYGQIKAEFGDVGSQSGYNKYMSNQNWTEAEHISVKNAIEAER